jgi:c-di-GMP-binding flagellar brake protein YcgR
VEVLKGLKGRNFTDQGGNLKMLKLREAEPRKMLESLITEKVPAILSYTSRDKWHATDVMPVQLGANSLYFEISSHKKAYPLNITIGQQVGISMKYDFGKIIFETPVTGLEPSKNGGSGIIVVQIPESVKMVSRRSYFRVAVPKSLEVNVQIAHHNHGESQTEGNWQGELIDISAGGLQVAIDAASGPNFKEGQFAELKFTPLAQEKALEFKALVRCILPSADEKSVCVGMQIVGLEASSEGRDVLTRICQVVEMYHQMNHSAEKQWSFLEGN